MSVSLLVVLVLISTVSHAVAEVPVVGYDSTLIKNSGGPDVVDACIQNMERVFPYDQQLLLRIFTTESKLLEKYFELTSMHIGDNGGGLWQIPRSKFTKTQTNITVFLREEIAKTYKVDWLMVTWSNILIPFYSALAARLYIDQTLGGDMPLSSELTKQGQYWATRYTMANREEQTSQYFVDTIKTINKVLDHKRFVVEVIYVVGLHSLENASAITELFRDLTLQIGLSSPFNQARIGFVLYNNDKPFFAIELYKYSTLHELVTAINSISFNSSSVNWINKALDFIYDNGFPVKTGEGLYTTAAIPKAVVVVTDMEIEHDSLQKSNGVFTFIYSLRNSTDMEELQLSFPNITMRSSIEYDQDEMNEFKEMVFYRLRRVSPAVDVYNKVHDTLKPKQVKYFNFPLTENGLTLKVNLLNDSITVYASGVIPNPNSAMFDIKFSGPIKEEAFLNYSTMMTHRQYSLLDRLHLRVENVDNNMEMEFSITAIPGNDIGVPTRIESFSVKASDSGNELLIECTVIGNPEPVITFYKRDNKLESGHNRIKINKKLLTGYRVLSVLEMELPTREDSGIYTCRSTNEVYNTSVYKDELEEDVIIVGGLGGGNYGGSLTKDIATNIRVHVLDYDHVMVSWSPPKKHQVKEYILFYKISDGINCTNATLDHTDDEDWKMKTTNKTSLILDHELVNGCTYEFKVRSILEPLPAEDLPTNNITVFINYSVSPGHIPDHGPKAIALLTAAVLLLIFIMFVMGILLAMQGFGYIKMVKKMRKKMFKDLRDMQRMTDHAMNIEKDKDQDNKSGSVTSDD